MNAESELHSAMPSERSAQASFWLWRHESAELLTDSELDHWEEWIGEPDNRAEYDGLVSTLCELRAQPRPGSRSRRFLTTLRAASAVFLVIGALLLLARREGWQKSIGADTATRIYATKPGEQRDFTMADDSVVTLAGDSRLTVTFGNAERTAVLGRGEGKFRVHHDPQRPFSVSAGAGVITAVGTVFDIRRYSDRVLVTVSEGAVEVVPRSRNSADALARRAEQSNGAHGLSLRVRRGEEVTYDSGGEIGVTTIVDPRTAESWVQGSLAYRGRPLHEVIEDVQRYSTRRIELDPRVADLKYTGTFVEDRLDQWLRGLRQIFPVEVSTDSPQEIVIRQRTVETALPGPVTGN